MKISVEMRNYNKLPVCHVPIIQPIPTQRVKKGTKEPENGIIAVAIPYRIVIRNRYKNRYFENVSNIIPAV